MSKDSLPNNVQIVEHQNIKWISIEHPDKASMDYLKEQHDFHALDHEDIMTSIRRSKLDKYEKYLFLILLFPFFNRKTKQIESAEIDFFIGEDYLITISNGEIPTFTDMFQLCETSEQARESLMTTSPQLLLYKVLQLLFQYCYPILDHINLEIEEIENRIFEKGEKKLLQEILYVRQNITDMRKIVQPHRATLTRLKKPNVELISRQSFELEKHYENYFDNLMDYTEEIWNQLDSFKESADALHETNESLISFRINEIMKTLTIFSVILLPASVVAGLFGVNAKHIPFVGHAQDFYIILGITLTAILSTLLYIKRKHLL
ncbi:MAG: magnesium transporter CorA family protein [bacterium]|nr:magnesium transporter CorA family protein [bacterium]